MSDAPTDSQPTCPNCARSLDGMPTRKKKCPGCGKPMMVRTRPVDRARILVTEQGAREIDQQWTAIHAKQRAMGFVGAGEFEREKVALSTRFGFAAPDNDVFWSLLNKQLTEHAGKSNWGLYRNTRLGMAELLEGEGKMRQALDTYLEIAYLDANGPNNVRDLGEFLPRFDPSEGSVFPGIVSQIAMLTEQLGLARADVQSAFLAAAARVHKNLRLPVPPEEGWRRLAAEWPPSDE